MLSDLAGSRTSRLEVLDTGHLGPALGRDARGQPTKEYWDLVTSWLTGS